MATKKITLPDPYAHKTLRSYCTALVRCGAAESLTDARKKARTTIPSEKSIQAEILRYLNEAGFFWKDAAGPYQQRGIPDIVGVLQADSGRHPCHDYCRQQQGGSQQGGSQRNRRTCRDPEKLPAVLYQRYQNQEQHRDRHLLPIRRHQCKRPLPHNKARQPLREKAHRQERDRLDRCKICDLRGRRRTWHRMTPASAWGAYPRSTTKQERPAWYSATKTAP